MKLVALAFALVTVGCSTRYAQNELGTPPQRFTGHSLVVVPRACMHVRSVPPQHLHETTLEMPAKTERLQAMLDTLDAESPQPIGPRPEEECTAPPDIADLTEIHATPDTIRAMQASGSSNVVVLELHATLACARSIPWSPNDTCLEEEVTVTAWMFDRTGAAIWGLTRAVGPTDEPGWVIDRILDRVPTGEPLRRKHGEYQVATSASRSRGL